MPRPFKYISISPRCEEERLASNGKPTGRYRARFPVNGRYTTKILKATTKREAAELAAQRRIAGMASLATCRPKDCEDRMTTPAKPDYQTDYKKTECAKTISEATTAQLVTEDTTK